MDITGYGLTLQLPAGWDGRVYKQSSQDAVTLEAASVRLASPADDSFQQTEATMKESDVYIRISAIGLPPPNLGAEGDWHIAAPPFGLRASDVRDAIEGHSLPAGIAKPVVFNNRALMTYVGFGSWPGRSELAQVTQLLSGLEVLPGPGG